MHRGGGQGQSKKAVPFIIKNQQTQCYELTQEAEELLKSVDKDLTVISVAGLYRTGKSYLLNRVILDKESIFGVGPTVNPCTKGLWIWVEPDPTCSKRSMLIVDTQGLGALDEESNHDMKIFCLAVLLSTTFIYNSVGSIDQNALQTLSLVLNLVSNIDQENTSSKPQFIWVVRDFTLQLIDEKGKTLTPRQYLEHALNSQNMKQQSKVIIRKTITNSFSERDCFTLVKPLIDQTKLQNMDNLPMDDLRPEFISQSIELRNRIKSSLKTFKLNSESALTGKEYVLVVKKYLSAINQGAVPNMIDTWTFIKEEKSREALEQLKKNYTEKIKSKIIAKIPMKQSFLEEQFSYYQEQIYQNFVKMTYEPAPTPELTNYLQNMLKQLIRLNEDENKGFIKVTLTKQYEPIMKKLFSQYYSNYNEFENEINKSFKQSIFEKYGPKIDGIKEHTDNFVQKKLIETFKMFEKKSVDEIAKLQAIKGELESALNQQASESNEARQKQRRIMKDKILQLERKIFEFQSEKQQMAGDFKMQKNLIESNMLILKKKNEEYAQTIEQLNKEVNGIYSAQSQLKEKSFMEVKEFQKEKALYIQKQEHLNGRIRELQSKTIELEGRLSDVGGKYENEKKYILKEYQDKIYYLEQETKRLTDKNFQSEVKYNRILDEAKELSEQIQKLKDCSESQRKKLEQTMLEAESTKKVSRQEHQLREMNQQLNNELQKTNTKFDESVKRVKILQEELKNMKNSSQKQIAIHVQQIQFQQIQIKDLKERCEQLKKSYQHAMENLHDSSKNNEESVQMKIFELNTEHQKEMKNLESEYGDIVNSLKKELQMLQRHKEEAILQQSLERKQIESKQKEWRQSNNMLQAMVRKLQQKLQSSEKDYDDISKEKQSFYSLRMKQLEQQLEETKQKTAQQIVENSRKSQQALNVLKHYSEMEKQQWEKRLTDERDRNEKKLKSTRDEYEKKISEERAALQEQISELQERLAHMDRVFNERLNNMQYDHDIAMQKITNQHMQEKVRLSKQLALSEQKLQMMKSSLEKQLSSKIKHYEELISSTKQAMIAEHLQKMSKVNAERQALSSKLESSKKCLRQVEQNNLILQNEVQKQKALFKQKQKTYEMKIVEIENRLQSELATYNKVIENINKKNNEEREKLNREIDKLNMNVVDLQEQKNRLQVDFETDKQYLNAKIKQYNDTKQTMKNDYEDISKKFEITIKQLVKERDKYKEKYNSSCKDALESRSKQCEELKENYETTLKKMNKNNEDRVSRLATENKSLKDRLAMYELEKSSLSKNRTAMSTEESDKIDAKYEKRIEEYKQLLKQEKQIVKNLREENRMLRMEANDFSNYSAMTYQERPSISEISNSRLYNQTGNNGATEIKRKFTNTPLISKKSRVVDVEEFGGVTRFNQRNDRKY